MKYSLNHLETLESEAVHIMREVVATAKNPVMLYSIGKDSSVLLRLAEKAFYPSPIPFPLLHIDTGFKFKEMIDFRDKYASKKASLIIHKNTEKIARDMKSEQANTERYIYYKKTKPLLEAISKHNFDMAICGARRDEEKSRAKERIFSFRDSNNSWNPKNQRPELWQSYNTHIHEGESIRVFPLSNWTEMDIWAYIKKEKIKLVPLYYAKVREVVKRGDSYYKIDEFVKPKLGEKTYKISCRYRSLGCSPSTGAVKSTATTLDEIIKELLTTDYSERNTRAIDQSSENSMEKKKKEGYF